MRRALACVVGDLSLVRALGRSGIPVAVAVNEAHSITAWSRYCRATVRTPSFVDQPVAAVAALIDWARQQAEPPVLFYQGDDDLVALSRARDEVERCMRTVLPPRELVEDLVDKLRFAALAERTRLPVPQTQVLCRGEALERDARAWNTFPAVLKPACRSRWFDSALLAKAAGTNQKVLRVGSRAELDHLLSSIGQHHTDFVLQRAVDGGEERILSYHAYVRPKGDVVVEFTGRKVRTAPRRYGLSTYVEITDDPEVKRMGRSVLEQLGFFGVVKMDFKRDARDERLYLLELNPRFNLWHHLATVAGACVPELVYRDCTEPDRALAPLKVRAGLRWLNTREDLRVIGEHRAAGEVSLASWLFQAITADVHEDLSLADPLPSLADLAGVAQRKLARLARMASSSPAGRG